MLRFRLLPSSLFGSRPVSRRSLLVGSLAAAACGHRRGPRYQGWLVAASRPERAIAVANLAQFKPAAKVALPHAPDELFVTRLGSARRIFALCRDDAEILEIDPAGFGLSARIPIPGAPVTARPIAPGVAVVITADPFSILAVDLARRTVSARVTLSAPAGDVDVAAAAAAVSVPASGSILRLRLPDLRILGETSLGVQPVVIRFRKDGRTVLTGTPAAREVVTIDAGTGALLTRLPLPIAPSRFCFNPDGGQMFVSGAGEDAIVIVNPYKNEVDQTILAGRVPGAMAASERRNLLFVTNPSAGDVTILDIDTRSLCATVHVGESPAGIIVTPGGDYALVLDEHSGNVSVIRITSVPQPTSPRRVSGVVPLFTAFSTAVEARSPLIVPFQS